MSIPNFEYSRRQSMRPVFLFAIGAVMAACSAGSGEGLDIAGRPLAEGGNVPLAPTLVSIQANVFDPFCVICHSGASAPLGLRLDAAGSFTNLVSVRSRQAGSLLRVAPGDPGRSYLVRKLEGTASEGGQMPLGGPPLPQSTIDFVRQWIADGALPGDEAPADGPPVVTSLSPTPGSVLGSLPVEIAAGFDREIDASTVNGQTFTLARSVDGDFDNGDDITVAPVSVGLSLENPRLAVMDLDGVAGVDDRYRVILRGSGPNVILDLDGQALDGEFTTDLPSGDGSEGGDFTAEFEIMGLQASLDSLQATVFSPSCAGCHNGTGGSLPGVMDLSDAAASFAALVNVASIQQPGLDRVEPGDPDASYLVRKLEGGPGIDGDRMPQGGSLDQATIDVLRQWIEDGALQ